MVRFVRKAGSLSWAHEVVSLPSFYSIFWGPNFFLRTSLVAQLVKNPPAMQEILFRFFLLQEIFPTSG